MLFLLVVSIALLGCAQTEKSLAAAAAGTASPAAPSGVQASNAVIAPASDAGAQAADETGEMPPSLPTDEEDELIPPAPASRPDASPGAEAGGTEARMALAHIWRIYSARLFYDIGGASPVGGTTRTLELGADGKWNFGDGSTGTWDVAFIAEDDWKKWGVEPYGPARKIVLDGWSGASADGPIEEGAGGVDFFWVIYRNKEQGDNAGHVQMKFGYR